MDAIIIFGNIPTLWPFFRWCTGKIQSRSGASSYGVYKNASSQPENGGGSEAFVLKGVSSNKRSGPTTRALQELDELQTTRTPEPSDGSSETEIVRESERPHSH
jgi:hypothetical protein